jgi:dihydroorotate dehydrogenase (NAD+) catalytic subunit
MSFANWYPSRPPIYDIEKSYEENAADGPFFLGEIPERKWLPEEKWIDFLGYPVASPIGVPAGPLLTANWVALAAALGYDIPIYKTIRSQAHPAHPLPNMVYVDTHGMIDPTHQREPALFVSKPTSSIEDLAVTNSFGMPSKSPAFLREDIPKANASLKRGQVMVVSVVGTVRSGVTFIDDFVAAARLAKECGAQIIEANFSCPNVDRSAGSLYMSPTTVFDIGHAIVKAIAPIPLIIKVGLFSSQDQMRDVMIAAARAQIRSIAGINTISMSVVDATGKPALGTQRTTSGICGGPIRKAAVRFIASAAQINAQEKLDLTLIGVGGITLPEHFHLFLNAGADIAMSATGMMWDPYLAARYHQHSSRS